ncbi:MAG: hypothetical protein AAGC76_11330 [Luteibacter sp.]|uniref:hypothetical protein n=1 Tax=Luteibacter sp. TaxID=1886636 RepID=UPI0028094653|nr:hypothetical protein [Luteibacter sp.]MDQ7996433.1 hypothetical protein [Luteibacter sp.]MDQ8047939.1 hypothetical protein [Luteibacter sp.]
MLNLFRRVLLSWPAFVVIVSLVMVWRRPDQFHRPYLWVEEGIVTLPAYLAHGWLSLFEPVAGYIVLPAKLIFLSAASISFTHLPRIEYWLTLVFEVSTLVLIAFSPSRLKFPVVAALAVALLPTDSEVYAVSEYAFWWGALWSFVAIFWQEGERPRTFWRGVLVAVGGFSSPMAIPAAAILGIRAAALRKRADVVVVGVAVAAAAVQWSVMHATGAMATPSVVGFDAFGVVTRFFGNFALAAPAASDQFGLVVGVLIIAGLCVFAVKNGKWRDPYFVMLLACLCASILASISRVPVGAIHPFLAGPRYFFFAYIFLAWLLLYSFPESGVIWRSLVVVVFFGALVQFALHGQRHHDTIGWRTELKKCSGSGDEVYPLLIHFDGNIPNAWHVPLTGRQCDELKRRGVFR